MMQDLDTLSANIETLDQQIRSFEESLLKAKKLKAKLEIEKAKKEQVLLEQQEQGDESGSEYEEEIEEVVEVTESEVEEEGVDEDTLALQRKIEELRRKLGQAGGESAKEESQPMPQAPASPVKSSQSQPMKGVNWSFSHSATPANRTSTLPSTSTAKLEEAPVSPAPQSMSPEPSNAQSDPYRSPKKYSFSKPDWAAQSSATDGGESGIITSPINNSRLRQAGSGYQRKVKPTESLDFVQGQHLGTKLSNAPEPRLAWVVLNVNEKKVGKIVLHLHGKSVSDIVDQFAELKGAGIERRPNRPLRVLDRSPKFFITTNKPDKLDDKPDVYGVIQEGHDVLKEVREAPEDASIVIRQAHIYPVKKAR